MNLNFSQIPQYVSNENQEFLNLGSTVDLVNLSKEKIDPLFEVTEFFFDKVNDFEKRGNDSVGVEKFHLWVCLYNEKNKTSQIRDLLDTSSRMWDRQSNLQYESLFDNIPIPKSL